MFDDTINQLSIDFRGEYFIISSGVDYTFSQFAVYLFEEHTLA